MLLCVGVMGRQADVESLLRIFKAALSLEQLKRLHRHAIKGTPICCGPQAWMFVDGKAAAIEVLANCYDVPRFMDEDPPPQAWQDTFCALVREGGKLTRLSHGNNNPGQWDRLDYLSEYGRIMETLPEKYIREAMKLC